MTDTEPETPERTTRDVLADAVFCWEDGTSLADHILAKLDDANLEIGVKGRPDFLRCSDCHTPWRYELAISFREGGYRGTWCPPKKKRAEPCKHPMTAVEALVDGEWNPIAVTE